MFVLVYAAHGIVGEDDSDVVITDTHHGAHYEMARQVREYVRENGLDNDDCCIGANHATAGLYDSDAPEWHIYEA